LTRYIYDSPMGLFVVKSRPDGRWSLWFREKRLGYYSSAVAAVDDVCRQCTGDFDWDTCAYDDNPTGISEWQRVGSP
jgi:hypothetical protein